MKSTKLLSLLFLSMIGITMLFMSCSKDESPDSASTQFVGVWEATYSTEIVASENPIIISQIDPGNLLVFYQDGNYQKMLEGELQSEGRYIIGNNIIKFFREDGNYASYRPIFTEGNQKLSLEWVDDSEFVYPKAPATITYQKLK